MGILSKLFGTDLKTVEEEHLLNVYEVELEFQNGETKTFEAYNEGDRHNGQIHYSTDLKLETSTSRTGAKVRIEGEFESYNVEVLAREPKVRKVADELWVVTYVSSSGRLKGGTQELSLEDRTEVEE